MTRREQSVLLRELVTADADIIASWSSDEEFCRAAGWTVRSVEEHRGFQRRLILAPPADLLRLAAVQDGRLVGYVDIHGNDPHRRELGFLVGPREAWGKGLGMAVASAGLKYGFHELKLKEIWAEALEANRASTRILKKLGMTETGWGDVETYFGKPSRYRRFVFCTDRPRLCLATPMTSTRFAGSHLPARGIPIWSFRLSRTQWGSVSARGSSRWPWPAPSRSTAGSSSWTAWSTCSVR